MIVSQLLAQTHGTLRARNLPPQDALILVAHALDRDKTYILAHPEAEVSPAAARRLQVALKKRLSGYSVAAVIGSKEFYGLRFAVSNNTLIPRPETELLIEIAAPRIDAITSARVLDVGTGSGNIIISLAKRCGSDHHYSASDVSRAALIVARKNAKAHRVSVRFFLSSLFTRIPRQKFDVIIANLPYLTAKQLQEPSIKKEPRRALYGGRDGIARYEQFFKQLPAFLAQPGLCLIEIDPVQSQKLSRIIKKYLPQASIAIHADLAGHDRALAIHL